ncbi:MAG: hypothetical protein BAJATHORv1_10427 [Candidatus Thorarchaeota archaeon]|nr:MAG: hypothetical protein BAJATHORv1_10427 [Candidatus Thorarchaeota archaeon]
MEDLANIAISAALETGVSFVDVRIENSISTIIEMTDGITKRALSSHLKGAGIRAFVGGAWAFAQTTDMTPSGMRETGKSVAKLALATKHRVKESFEIHGPTYTDRVFFKPKKDFRDIPIEDKIHYTKTIDDQARVYDERVTNTRTVYGELWTNLYVVNSFGTSIYRENSLPRIVSVTTAKEGSNRQRAYRSFGTLGGFEKIEQERPQNIGTESAKKAIELLDSKAAKGGTYDVVMDPVLNGVMVHEAFGHACEADGFLAHATVLEDKLDMSVGPDHLNISDDPTIPEMRGSFEYDWEGTKTQKRCLVKDGILTELLHSLETASRLDMTTNGSARAQSFMDVPIPRMSNTFMEPGDWERDEIIAETKNGILLCNFNYGYTEPAKGQFMFQASHGYMIENGELGQMVRDVSLAGQILDILSKIDAVGNDFQLEAGTCGKNGQSVPDMSGGPHARIIEIPVGGM